MASVSTIRLHAPASLYLSARITHPNPTHPLLGHTGPPEAQQGLGVLGPHERHRYARTNFKLNRAAALADWRQLLSA